MLITFIFLLLWLHAWLVAGAGINVSFPSQVAVGSIVAITWHIDSGEPFALRMRKGAKDADIIGQPVNVSDPLQQQFLLDFSLETGSFGPINPTASDAYHIEVFHEGNHTIDNTSPFHFRGLDLNQSLQTSTDTATTSDILALPTSITGGILKDENRDHRDIKVSYYRNLSLCTIQRTSEISSTGTVGTTLPASPPAAVEKPRNKTGIIVGVALAILVIIVLLLVVVFKVFRQRRQEHRFQSLDPLIINDVIPERSHSVAIPFTSRFTYSGLAIPRIREEKATVELMTQASDRVESTSTAVSGSSRQDRLSSSGVELPVELEALVEIERLRLENQILRRQFIPESSEESILPPSYPGSVHSSRISST
ncbi:hypothetical protein C8J56DRAFT_1114952 [Mycena floridula]|nr:hypothetical protein C8J56DRAFT_1114952 [Mycena floridula]